MKVLIIEDERYAAHQLSTYLEHIPLEMEVLEVVESVRLSKEWLKNNAEPDLIFMDIQLSDGICFEIFQSRELLCPVIFTTAFDHYIINAFQANCIDYLLKPYTQEDVENALTKYEKLQARSEQIYNSAFVEKVIPSFQKNYKSRFFAKSGNQLFSIPIEEIAFFYTEDFSTLLVTTSSKRFVINFSLDQLEELLDPTLFFRINRQFLLHQQGIDTMEALGKGRIQLRLKHANFSALMVSRGRTPEFKEWLGR